VKVFEDHLYFLMEGIGGQLSVLSYSHDQKG
jgi:hypothetical protein